MTTDGRHGNTSKKERTIKNASLRQNVMAVRLVMEGGVAAMMDLCRQTVTFYVSLFNEGGLGLLPDRKHPPGREPFLTDEQQHELKQTILTQTPAKLGWDMASSGNTKIVQSYIQQ